MVCPGTVSYTHLDVYKRQEWTNPVGLHGDLMKVFKNQDIPGVDVIGYYGYTQEAYKIISSAANNWDKGLVMSESFGAMGEGMNKNVLYKSSMDQYAKGVNMIVPHALWYDDTSGKVSARHGVPVFATRS